MHGHTLVIWAGCWGQRIWIYAGLRDHMRIATPRARMPCMDEHFGMRRCESPTALLAKHASPLLSQRLPWMQRHTLHLPLGGQRPVASSAGSGLVLRLLSCSSVPPQLRSALATSRTCARKGVATDERNAAMGGKRYHTYLVPLSNTSLRSQGQGTPVAARCCVQAQLRQNAAAPFWLPPFAKDLLQEYGAVSFG